MKRLPMPASIFASLVLALAWFPAPSVAATAAQITAESEAALKKLYANNPKAKELGTKAVAVLVFPKVVKAGLMVGGQYGEGALLKGGKPDGFYSTAGASYGLQAGAQTYGHALFYMNADSLNYLNSSNGFEVGVGPTAIVADETYNKQATTTTIQNAIYAFIFNQKGAMAAMGVQGNKITKLQK